MRILIIISFILNLHTELSASTLNLRPSVHQPQTTFRLGLPKKKSVKVRGSVSKEDRDEEDEDEDEDEIDVDPNNFSPSNIFALDMEIFQSQFSNIGILLELDIPKESSEEADKKGHAFQYSIRLGGFFRFIAGEIYSLSPFAKAAGSFGVNLGNGFGGNALKLDASCGLIYYFSEFFGLEMSYGTGYEIVKFYGSLASGQPSSNLTTTVVETQFSMGFKSTFW